MAIDIPNDVNLAEYEGSVQITKEHLDSLGHVNNARYWELYEAQRALYCATSGLTVEQIVTTFGVLPAVVDYEGRFLRQVFEGDQVKILTAALPGISHLKFRQRMFRDEEEVAYYRCTIFMINKDSGKATRVPYPIRYFITEANSKHSSLILPTTDQGISPIS